MTAAAAPEHAAPSAAAAPATAAIAYPTAPAMPLAPVASAPPQPQTAPSSILIVASAFKAPGGSSPTSFLLQQQQHPGSAACADGSAVVPLARWDVDLALPSHMPGELQPRFGCFLAGIEGFDPEAVGMTPAEALLVDPQQRLVMEAFGEVAAATTAAGVYSR